MFTKLKDLRNVNLIQLLRLHKIRKQLIFVIAIAGFVMLNIFLSPLAWRLDLSRGKAYTLSQSTKKIIQKNDKKIEITFFVTSDLPTQMLPLKTDVTDLLKEYEKQGKNIRVTIVDPKKDQSAMQKIQKFGIPQVQFSQLQQDQYAVTASYFGIGIQADTEIDSIPQVVDVESLEYNLTSSIYTLTRKDIPKIGIIGYSAQLDPSQDPIGGFKEILNKQFLVEPITLATESGKTSIDSSYKAVIVFNEQNTIYSSFELDILKSYLDKKGKVLFFVDGVWVDESLIGLPAQHNADILFEEYGMKVEKNLVLSSSAEVVNFGNDLVSMYTAYPFWLKTGIFAPQATYFSNIYQLTFPWTSSLTLQKKNGYEVKELVKTTEQSWQQKDAFMLNPQQISPPQEKDLKQFIIAAESTNKNGGKLVVIPSSRFLLNRFYAKQSGNFNLGLNIMSDLASEGALSGIRQRAVNIYQLPPNLTEQSKNIFKYLNIFLLPSLFAIYGAYRIMKRK